MTDDSKTSKLAILTFITPGVLKLIITVLFAILVVMVLPYATGAKVFSETWSVSQIQGTVLLLGLLVVYQYVFRK